MQAKPQPSWLGSKAKGYAISDVAPADMLREAVGHPHPELEGLLDDDVPLPPLGALILVPRSVK